METFTSNSIQLDGEDSNYMMNGIKSVFQLQISCLLGRTGEAQRWVYETTWVVSK
jgi:hypothetical protein